MAARRLLAVGELFAFPVPEWERLRNRLPKVIRRLGRVRNLDVAIRFLKRGRTSDRNVRKALIRSLKRQRRKERSRLEKWLDGDRIRRLREPLDRVLKEVRRLHVTEQTGPEDLLPLFSRILSLYADRAWSTDPEAAHDVRREVRRLRYAHETLVWAYSEKDFRKARKALRRVQDLAGAWHDCCALEGLARKAARKGRVKDPVDPLVSRLRSDARSLVGKFVSATSELIALRPEIVGSVR